MKLVVGSSEQVYNSRCFEYAHLADRLSNSVPEYRQEYEKIALHCRELSVELLDHCNKTTEIDRILRESGCSSKYFRNSDDMTYPRLRLAIEHNHKEFVGHIYRLF